MYTINQMCRSSKGTWQWNPLEASFDERLNMGYFLKGLSVFGRKICKFSVILAPPIWTAWVVTPFSFYTFKGKLTVIAYEKCNEFLNAGYILNGFKCFDRLIKGMIDTDGHSLYNWKISRNQILVCHEACEKLTSDLASSGFYPLSFRFLPPLGN